MPGFKTCGIHINVNELLTGHADLPVPETVEDAVPLSHSFQFFC